jgi:hypothetical protein
LKEKKLHKSGSGHFNFNYITKKFFFMKWARVIKNPTGQSSVPGDQGYKNDQISFRDYTSEAELKADIGNEENQWFNYKFSYDYGQQVKNDFKDLAEPKNKVAEYIESFKKRYEAFCGGYLFFYDVAVRNATIEHVIYFNWEVVTDENGNTDFSVTAFISPAPARSITDNSDSQKSEQQGTDANISQHKAGKLTSKEYSTASHGVDPPEPPPPPPPSMH